MLTKFESKSNRVKGVYIINHYSIFLVNLTLMVAISCLLSRACFPPYASATRRIAA